ncbi:hypothetical protein BD324DRAFT_650204 [Kockovaella imperatae]|uniref:Uncharacterized protein n=1 Tax=Kockovaella imperatae TaxID=4999 RepID=A0A1Y1UHV0_9TREE|nr:hypothetical protein BD324DRAFT_650204 [Kockovaella imperatae]ORX37640.1 hypothetical protein BD324DRAFT_650204 [Kockovaella imperatae]
MSELAGSSINATNDGSLAMQLLTAKDDPIARATETQRRELLETLIFSKPIRCTSSGLDSGRWTVSCTFPEQGTLSGADATELDPFKKELQDTSVSPRLNGNLSVRARKQDDAVHIESSADQGLFDTEIFWKLRVDPTGPHDSLDETIEESILGSEWSALSSNIETKIEGKGISMDDSNSEAD